MVENMSSGIRQIQVLRHGLLQRLDYLPQYLLTLIQAPAGSGKTTLLRQWRQQWQGSHADTYVVNLRLQKIDNDPVRFFRNLAEFMRVEIDGFDVTWFHPFNDQDRLNPEILANSIVQATEQLNKNIVVILDDFQFIHAEEICNTIDHIFSLQPRHLNFLIASRTAPKLSISQLKINDQLLLLESSDLAMTESEVGELYQRHGLDWLSQEDVRCLLNVTEGWSAGIKIALLAAERSGIDAIRHFSGNQPDIVDYFGHVVLRGLPDHLYRFFLQSSIFERLNGDLCDKVLDSSQSARILEELTASELFVLREENRPGWYRYHSLMHDFLHNRLVVEQPELLPELHSRAADYFIVRNELEQALIHSRKSQNLGHYIATIKHCFTTWSREGHFDYLLPWMEKVDQEYILNDFELMARIICSLTLSRHFNRAEYYLSLLKQHQAFNEPKNKETLDFLKLQLQLFQHETDFMQSANIKLLKHYSQHRDIRAFSLAMLAYYHLQHAHMTDALQYASQARETLQALKEHFVADYAGLILILCKRQTGLLGEAIKDVQAAFYQTPKYSPSWVLWATGMVVVYYDQNELQKARSLCEELIPKINSTSATEVIATVYLLLSRLHFHFDDKNRATRILEKLLAIIQLGKYERFVSRTGLEMMRQAILSDNTADVERAHGLLQLDQWLRQFSPQNLPPYDESWEQKGLAASLYLSRQGRFAEAKRILLAMRDLLISAGVKNRIVVYEANLAVLNSRDSDRSVRARVIRELIEKCNLLTLNRSVLDEAPGFEGLLRVADQENLIDVSERYRSMFRDIFDAVRDSTPPTIDDPTALLTGKEMEILNCVLGGLSNAEIGEKTGTSITTVKWHLRNVYAKLNVSNRTEAILRVSPRASVIK